jgi:hypothetical protein
VAQIAIVTVETMEFSPVKCPRLRDSLIQSPIPHKMPCKIGKRDGDILALPKKFNAIPLVCFVLGPTPGQRIIFRLFRGNDAL